MGRTRTKICGIRNLESALVAVEAGADALGFVFAAGSPRLIDPDEALDIAGYLPPFVARIALMVNPTPSQAADLAAAFPFEVLQLHGQETPAEVARCRAACGTPMIKAIRYDAKTIDRDLALWAEVSDIDALLIDGGAGGEGTALPWADLAPKVEDYSHPVILAGGLAPGNVTEAIELVQPFAVDVSSGVERARGVKDHDLIWELCAAVRRADAAADARGSA